MTEPEFPKLDVLELAAQVDRSAEESPNTKSITDRIYAEITPRRLESVAEYVEHVREGLADTYHLMLVLWLLFTGTMIVLDSVFIVEIDSTVLVALVGAGAANMLVLPKVVGDFYFSSRSKPMEMAHLTRNSEDRRPWYERVYRRATGRRRPPKPPRAK